MVNKQQRILYFLFFVIILPFILFFISYYGFEPTYTGIKKLEGPPEFIYTSVYAYRVIPNFFSDTMLSFITYVFNHHLSFAKSYVLKYGTLYFHSIFLINSFFFLLSSVVLHKIINYKFIYEAFKGSDVLKKALHLLAVFLIVITQYVATNGDSISLFFLLLGTYFTLKHHHEGKKEHYFGLILVVLVSTFVRESSCLNIALFAAILWDGKISKNFISSVFPLVLAFLLPYVGLRLAFSQSVTYYEDVYFMNNFKSPLNLMGLLFGILVSWFFYGLIGNSESKLRYKYFYLFSVPYIIMIFLVGVFWETRLFMPLILIGFTIAFHEFKNKNIVKV